MRKDDKLDELESWQKKKEIEDGIRKGLTKWAHTICMTATSAIMGAVWWIGGVLYDKWAQFSAAIDAFIKAGRQ